MDLSRVTLSFQANKEIIGQLLDSDLLSKYGTCIGEHGDLVVEHWTLTREVLGLIPTPVLCCDFEQDTITSQSTCTG